MIANYHTHTWRCLHARGDEREYVELAIAAGLRILGFSDHAPVPYEGGYVSSVRMLPEQLEDYVDTVLRLRDEYRRDIEIHLGLEVEYYPAYIDAQLRLYEPYPVEYFLLGQHYLGNEIGEPYCGRPGQTPEALMAYCRQTAEALESGLFSCFAHPDLIRFSGDDRLYEKEMRALCQKASDLNVPLEINLLGIEIHKHYPNPLFWKIAGEVGNTAILGADIHDPGNMHRPDAVEEALSLADRFHLKIQDTMELRRPGR